jgi:hypothetical protein
MTMPNLQIRCQARRLLFGRLPGGKSRENNPAVAVHVVLAPASGAIVRIHLELDSYYFK